MEKPETILPEVNMIQALKVKDIPYDFTFQKMGYVSGNISFKELFILCLAVRIYKPRLLLEFGTFNGRTTLNLILNAEAGAKILTVDLPRSEIDSTHLPLERKQNYKEVDELGYIGLENKVFNDSSINKNIKKKITQVWADTADFGIKTFNPKFDFAFVDASHSYENVLNDAVNVTTDRITTEKAVIFFHDYDGWPGVTKALNEFYAIDGWKMQHIKDTSLVILKKGEQ